VRNVYKDMNRELESKRPLGRLCRWKGTIKTDFKEMILGGLDRFFGSGYRDVMGMCEHNNECLGTIKSRYFMFCHSDHKFLRKASVT
jgi:hypothetical protein